MIKRLKSKENRQKLIKKLNNKFRLIIYNDNSFEEVFSFKLSRINVLGFGIVFFVFMFILLTFIISITPLKEFLPNYSRDIDIRKKVIESASRVQDLEQDLESQKLYYQNLRTIINGQVPSDNEIRTKNEKILKENIKFTKTKEDSVLRANVEKEERYNPVEEFGGKKAKNIVVEIKSFTHLFAPVKGIVIQKYNPAERHFGVDIAAKKNTVVSAVSDGVVIIASWTLDTGYIIAIQHPDNLMSFYKHNSRLFKKVGDKVKEGDAVAVVGNSGEITTGPHLHFELWQQGISINPENLIVF